MFEGDPHRFGSVHTQIKLGALANYLPAYTKALQSKDFTLHYVDAFAGTGKCTIKAGLRDQTIPGSAWIALTCKPPFQRMLLIEKSRKKFRELTSLVKLFPHDGAQTHHGDANDALPPYLGALTRSDRAIVNLDPFGMHVNWDTLEKIASTRLADVCYLFSLSGFYRQAARDASDIDTKKEAALSRVLGPHDWRAAFYAPPRQGDIFGGVSDIRESNALRMAEWVTECLKKTFPGVVGPKILYQNTATGKQGPPIFALYFLISNPEPKAVALFKRLASAVLKP